MHASKHNISLLVKSNSIASLDSVDEMFDVTAENLVQRHDATCIYRQSLVLQSPWSRYFQEQV